MAFFAAMKVRASIACAALCLALPLSLGAAGCGGPEAPPAVPGPTVALVPPGG
ncbi:MAG: hypothetical protein JWP97_546, partial [Labilithrix sp.]|nr:hypothetical protein [Labilithrix sp.]